VATKKADPGPAAEWIAGKIPPEALGALQNMAPNKLQTLMALLAMGGAGTLGALRAGKGARATGALAGLAGGGLGALTGGGAGLAATGGPVGAGTGATLGALGGGALGGQLVREGRRAVRSVGRGGEPGEEEAEREKKESAAREQAEQVFFHTVYLPAFIKSCSDHGVDLTDNESIESALKSTARLVAILESQSPDGDVVKAAEASLAQLTGDDKAEAAEARENEIQKVASESGQQDLARQAAAALLGV